MAAATQGISPRTHGNYPESAAGSTTVSTLQRPHLRYPRAIAPCSGSPEPELTQGCVRLFGPNRTHQVLRAPAVAGAAAMALIKG